MKRLLLFRHAKSEPYDAEADHERRLVASGRAAATGAGERLREAGAVPDLVLCSSAARTRETLECAQAAIAAELDVRIEPRIYGASVGELLTVIQAVDDAIVTLMVVGHNPGMHMLAASLASSGDALGDLRAKFPTAAVADLRFAGSWAGLAPGAATLAGFPVPSATGV